MQEFQVLSTFPTVLSGRCPMRCTKAWMRLAREKSGGRFDCSNNQLKDLPSSLGQCAALSELKGNKLIMLPKEMIASCTMLTEINASKNMLSAMPDNIGSLSRLIRLDLHQNRISSIPSSINGCLSLLEFYMGNNDLSSLPAEIGALTKLGTFDLHSNKLKEYPVEACTLQLSVLDLSNNSLSGLPPEIGLMTTLRKLLLNGNPLRTLRSSLVNGPTAALLKFLRSRLPTDEGSAATATAKEDVITMAARMSFSSKEISLEGLGLNVVPSEAWKSSDIIKVNLSKNAIEELPVEFSSCISLEALILSKNKIKEWPGGILKSLPKFSCLKLDNNPLRQIASNAFQTTPKLQILDLSGNAGCLPEHPEFSSMPELQELYLRRMQISVFPAEIMSLKQLRTLDLSQNSLQHIPQGIKDMTRLTELDLSDNNISALPPELGLLEPSLQVLKLDGNPLRSIRRTILDRGTKAILKYLKERVAED
ncbi:plant intracellular Ras-group-related LRR protein 6-like isoform X5 [Coffea arabica]|uniref:Plant intracellular Ras-group-related LRR protein 6-like isoform X5 n=1 Tax=Coffea arabica TaxID=13443 RepID=A0ABM4UDE0_COFAR